MHSCFSLHVALTFTAHSALYLIIVDWFPALDSPATRWLRIRIRINSHLVAGESKAGNKSIHHWCSSIHSIRHILSYCLCFPSKNIFSIVDCAMLVMVWHLPAEGTMTTLVRKCSLSDGSWCSFAHLFGMPFSMRLQPIYLFQRMSDCNRFESDLSVCFVFMAEWMRQKAQCALTALLHAHNMNKLMM